MRLYTNAPNGASGDEWQNTKYQFDYFLSKVNTALPVKVVNVKTTGVAPVGYVDVKPMTKQMTVSGRSVENPVIYNVPYFRYQGGKNAVIIDPEVGDRGVAVFSQRDISSVKRTRDDANCGSLRMHDLGDAMYFGGFMNDAPQQYVMMSDAGIKLFSPVKVEIEAPVIVLNTPLVTILGKMEMTGKKGEGATMKGGVNNSGGSIVSNGVTLETHVHNGVTPGSGNTGKPV